MLPLTYTETRWLFGLANKVWVQGVALLALLPEMNMGPFGDARRYATIRKDVASLAVAPNVLSYGEACANFSWVAARSMLDGLPGRQGLNIAHEAVDRHAHGARADKVALRWIG